MLDTFIQELAREMEVGNTLPIDSEGVFALPLEEDVKILITAIPEGFSLTCTFVATPTSKKEFYLTRCLLANLFGQGTHHAVIGMTEDGKLMSLNRTINYTVDYKEFRAIIEQFINTVDFWRAEAIQQSRQ